MAIELRGVTKRYGATAALDNVSVSFGGGMVYGLLGANGAGRDDDDERYNEPHLRRQRRGAHRRRARAGATTARWARYT